MLKASQFRPQPPEEPDLPKIPPLQWRSLCSEEVSVEELEQFRYVGVSLDRTRVFCLTTDRKLATSYSRPIEYERSRGVTEWELTFDERSVPAALQVLARRKIEVVPF